MRLIQNGGEIALATGQAVGKKNQHTFFSWESPCSKSGHELKFLWNFFTSCAMSSKESMHIVNDFSPFLHMQGKISRKGKMT